MGIRLATGRPRVTPSHSSPPAMPNRHPSPRWLLCALSGTVLLSSCTPAAGGASPAAAPQQAPRSIILLVADGAGPAHWTLAAFEDDDLAVGRMRTVGLVDTRGADHTVSGSAPTATAYATGVRARMGMVGVGPDSLPRESVVEAAMERGMSTGLLTTTAIVDATPAAFGAHHVSRGASGEIARQMVSKGITVLMGGGRAAFRPEAQPDSRDLLSEVRATYTYLDDVDDLRTLRPDTIEGLVGLFAEGGMGTVAERGDALQVMTSTALDVLGRDPDGFFLLVENEESDTQSHRNSDRTVVTAEMSDFDAAVGLALDYQESHPETLVLVTGDHETGGVSLTYDPSDPERGVIMRYASGSHTGVLLPLFARGPGAERFGGIIRNDRVGQILLEMVRNR